MINTRFAPSPTGYLHIGGARTALFSWLYAKQQSGNFRLRIEDTDQSRHNALAVQAIIDGLNWLGLYVDKDIVFQSKNIERHKEVVSILLENDLAYRCYLDGTELQELKDKAKKENKRFTSPYRDRTIKKDLPFAIRFKAPLDGETIIYDKVQGKVTLQNNQLDDLVILRSNAMPTYNLAVIVDDYDMAITHVIRGDDHLVNTARQIQLLMALDWKLPVYAHLPMIHSSEGKKLSKRDGAQKIEDFQAMGIVPPALRNYLLKLGFAYNDEEIITDENALKWFSLKKIKKSPARLDMAKLNFINKYYLNNLPIEEINHFFYKFIENSEQIDFRIEVFQQKQNIVAKAMPFLLPRVSNFLELAKHLQYLLADEKELLQADILLFAKPCNKEILENFLKVIDNIEFAPEKIKDALSQFSLQYDLKFGQFAPVIRKALSYDFPSPDLAITIFTLGEVATVKRLQKAIDMNIK